jgi:hypothetical protein
MLASPAPTSAAAAIVKMPSLFPSRSAGSDGPLTPGSLSDSEFDDFYDCEEGRDVEEFPHAAVASSPLLKYRDLLYRRRYGAQCLLMITVASNSLSVCAYNVYVCVCVSCAGRGTTC